MDPAANGSPVVARFTDGRVLKGTTRDFSPQKAIFHLSIWGEPNAKAITVPVGALKGLFFVKSYEGDPKHVEDNDLAKRNGPGRKVMVTFNDGEVICGLTNAYSKDTPGFFLTPADPNSNNHRIFVVVTAVRKLLWAEAAVPAVT